MIHSLHINIKNEKKMSEASTMQIAPIQRRDSGTNTGDELQEVSVKNSTEKFDQKN